ncbi:MAG: hypothetical protein AMXMBFR64_45260 [Myxococcales bacterium]
MRASLSALVVLVGCAHAPGTPREAAGAWAEAMRAGDDRGARRLVSPDAVEPDLAPLRAMLGDGEPSAARLLVDVRSDQGAVTVALGPEGGRIVTEVVPPLAGTTPEGAARAFLGALDGSRPGLLVTVMPSARADEAAARAVLASEATAELLRSGATRTLADALREPARRSGDDRAWVEGDGWRLSLIREPGGWKVEDIRREEPWR